MSEPKAEPEKQLKETEPMEAEEVLKPTDGSPVLEPVFPEQEQMGNRPGGEGGRFVCKKCRKSFNSKAELDMHVESMHESENRKGR